MFKKISYKDLKEKMKATEKQVTRLLEKLGSLLQDKNNLKQLGIITCILLLVFGLVCLIGFMILTIYRFVDNHLGELTIIAICIGAFFGWLQSGKDQREAKRRKVLEEKQKALMPKANAIYEKIGLFAVDILRDNSLSSLISLAKPSNLSNIIMENPSQRIQIKPDGSGYLLTYRVDKLSIARLDQEHLLTIRDVLQGSMNQRIASYGINGLCPAKQNTFLHVMGEPSDCLSFVTICMDYSEEKLNDTYEVALVFDTFSDRTYGN